MDKKQSIKKVYNANDDFAPTFEQLKILEKAENKKYNKDFEGAIKLLNEILYEDPGCVPALEELADCQLSLSQDDKALKTSEFILGITEKSYSANYLAGFILSKKGEFKKSIKYLSNANTLRPNNPEVLRCYGWSIFMGQNKIKGISILERARNLSPNDTQILNDLAVCMIEIGQIQKGIDIISEIQDIDPGNKRSLFTLDFLEKNNIINK